MARLNVPIILLVQLALLSCGGDSRATSNGEVARARQATPAIIPATTPAYRAVTVSGGGSIVGTVDVDGPLPPDTAVSAVRDELVCADAPNDVAPHRGTRLGNVIVWLEGVREGKALPLARRYTVDQDGCRVVPRVSAVVSGGMLNVHSSDPLVHKTRFVRSGSRDLVSLVSEVDAGQVVPDPRIVATPGLIEISCDLHPWTRGYLAVFDHPYFAVTMADGAFRFDEVPAGNYTLVAWHERSGRVQQQVTVAAGGTVNAQVRLKLR